MNRFFQALSAGARGRRTRASRRRGASDLSSLRGGTGGRSERRSLPRERPVVRSALGALGLWLLCLAPGLAGPPYFTDDPDAIPFRHWEFYVASMQAGDGSDYSGTGPHFELNYGLAPNVMVHVITALSFDKPRGRAASYGLGDMEVGAIFRFVDETDGRPQVGTFPHLEIPTGNARRGLGSGQAQVFIPLWVKKTLGSWTTFGGGGYWFNPGPDRRDFWYAGWVIQRDFPGGSSIGAEIFHTTPGETGERGETGFNMGAIIALGKKHALLLSAGRDLRGPGTFFMYLAFYSTFGPGD